MIAKLICWGEDRAEAMLRMRRALEEFTIMGVKHNIPFHQNLLNSFSFIAGKFDTNFVEERFSMTTYEGTRRPKRARNRRDCGDAVRPPQTPAWPAQVITPHKRDTSNWKWVGALGEVASMKYVTTINDKHVSRSKSAKTAA